MDLSGVRVLVIDDHPDSLDIEQEVLEWAGADVVVARSAKEADRLWAPGRFDVILGDLADPERGTIALVRRRRALGDRTPALGLSSYPEIAEADTLAAGFDRFLEKPVETGVLIDSVGELVGARTRRPPGAGPRDARTP